MVLVFTEEQKKEIEARGMKVIEFKCWLRKTRKVIDDTWQILKEFAEKIEKAFKAFKEQFLEAMDSVAMAIEAASDCYNYPTSLRYKFVKVLSKCTGIRLCSCWKATWKVKRWLARSCC